MEYFENLVEWFRDSYSQLKGLGVEDKKEVIGYVVIILSVFITFIVSLHNNYASNKSQLPEEKIML